ncbi:Leucine-rich repeat-containing protein 59 [Trachymyrmex septentrionalis]|uniref:Leucine-rich repeat-containing protein 59 n=1 Tax=Trachymyrmex septentrionalis TaxID=34720 RepID=A0A151JUU4_9HYME|nr:PREDICTED: leucine-rich repeat-containing protein 59 [Trachymyrmex septentrionalis]KYN36567.1 Leucine-rich repeat-containing protein 59 [Trachymyrmex septentrionalis]
MTIKLKLKDVKDKLREDTLDLSLCDLEEVPVREIASVRKATNVNLSTNLLVLLPATFVTLKQIVKLDLSRNMLVELPENFGEMSQLKHLDLYANKISRLPLSLSELKNLRWLDLKENPLTEAVASVAGPCSNMRECQACARNIVTYLSNVKLVIEEERLRRLNNVAGDADKEMPSTKKENKKKKKKKDVEREKMNGNKTNSPTQSEECLQDNSDSVRLTGSSSNNASMRKSYKSTGTGLCRSFTCVIVWFFVISSLLTVTMVMLSWHYEQQTDTFLQNAQTLSGLPLKNYHRQTTDYLQRIIKIATVQIKSIIDVANDFYRTQFESGTSKEEKEL